MGAVYKYIHANYNETPDVYEVTDQVNLSTPEFCRYFKKQTKMTFADFVNQYRITQAKTFHLKDVGISQACYQVGFESFPVLRRLSPRSQV